MAKKTNLSIIPDFLRPENRPVQYFTKDYIDQCKKMSLLEIVEKIDQQQQFFWKMHQEKNHDESILISLKIPKNLLKKFRALSDQKNIKYQTQIKVLMQEWLLKSS